MRRSQRKPSNVIWPGVSSLTRSTRAAPCSAMVDASTNCTRPGASGPVQRTQAVSIVQSAESAAGEKPKRE